MRERRVKVWYVDYQFFLGILAIEGRYDVVEWGVPKGSRVLSVHQAQERDCFAFVVEHESFEPVGECCALPELEDAPVVREVHDSLTPSERWWKQTAESRYQERRWWAGMTYAAVSLLALTGTALAWSLWP